ncbi:hypothetical protein F2Q69_00040491 [Brassica cretica]|uniref:Uncharacterized protein n=1 Tax=Brassica cretica TaxID=69181 RepID=A0A8S9NIZ9_BRACR|nr:hypothetical protein F2Q69_00040491 [Brassica cretica]
MVLIFHSFKGFSDLDLDMQVFRIWKTSGVEDFQTTSRKSSRRLPGSLLTESSPMSPFHNRSERFGFSDLDLDMQVFRIWKTSGVEDFQTTSRKSSRRLPGSLLTESSPMSPFHNRSERFGFNQMVLIFHLDMYFVCFIKVFTDLGLIYMFFRSGSDFGRPMGSLLGSLLKYNALEDFQ